MYYYLQFDNKLCFNTYLPSLVFIISECCLNLPMLTGKELILATKPFAKEIRWKSWYHTLTTFILLIASIIGSLYLPNIFLQLACSVCTAALLSRFFIIFHDYQHH